MVSAVSRLDAKRLSLAEAAQKLDVASVTVWRWIVQGVDGRKLPALRIGRRRYILVTDLEAFIAPDVVDSREGVAHG